jgi:hypothetical protein
MFTAIVTAMDLLFGSKSASNFSRWVSPHILVGILGTHHSVFIVGFPRPRR